MRVPRLHRRGLRGLAVALISTVAGGLLVAAHQASAGPANADARQGSAHGLGQLSGLLPADHLTVESALRVDLSRETVRLPLYKGTAKGKTVWYVLLDASDKGLADDLGVNYAPKLSNIGIGCPTCIETVTQQSPTPQQNRLGPVVINFQDAPDFSPTRTDEVHFQIHLR